MDQETIVAEFVKNKRECVRAVVKTWSGREVFDLRVYYRDPTGEWRPGSKGLCLKWGDLPQLKAAILALELAINKEDSPQ